MGNQDSKASAKFHVTKNSFGLKILELQPSVRLFLSFIIVPTLATLFAEWVRPHDPYKPDLRTRNQPPSLLYVLFTSF